MNRIRVALASLLLLGLTVVCYAQSTGQSQTSAQQSPTLNQEEQKHPEVAPPPQPTETAPQQPEAAPPRTPEEKPPAQKEEKPGKEEAPSQEQPKAGHEEHGKTADHAHAHPAGKSVHIPDSKFKASFGRQHTFTVKKVITTTTIVPNQTQFVLSGFTFVFLDPWPAGWLLTDDCFIDFIDDEYVLVDVLHPGVTVALLVVG